MPIRPKPPTPPAPPAPPPVAPVVPDEPPTTYRVGSYGNASIDRWDAAFLAASEAVKQKRGVWVDPHVTKAMMDVESGGDGSYPPDRCRPADAYDNVPACGPMQIKFEYHREKCSACDLRAVPGQIELAAHILGEHMQRTGGDEYAAITAVYFPGADSNGTTQAKYLARVRKLVAAMAADAGAGDPEPPKPPQPTHPLSAILGGRPIPAISYGWLSDEGLDYYSYGVSHGTQRSTQHPAVDVPLPCGTPLYAPAAGVVDCVGNQGTPRWGQACGAYADNGGGVGNITILLDGGVKLTLGHCRTADVRPGQRVAAGQRVGTVGDFSGCHTHVETSVERGGSYWLTEPVAALRSVMGGTTPPAPQPIAPPLRVAIAENALRLGNRPGRKLDGNDLWATVHETANTAPGANAEMHRQFVDEGGGRERVSFHFAVDDREVVQILPLDEIGFHAGDGCDSKPNDTGCFRSVGIETCVNADGDWQATLGNLAALLAALVTNPDRFAGGAGKRFSFDRIAPHMKWSGKRCPVRMLAGNLLPGVVSEARSRAEGATPPPPAEPKPDALLLALFPLFDPNGPVSKAWLECRERDKAHHPFIRWADDGPDRKLWIFDGLVLRSEGARVEEVAP